jgi:hypothetical protein
MNKSRVISLKNQAMIYRENWSRKAKNDVRRGRPDRYRSYRAEQQVALVRNLRKAASRYPSSMEKLERFAEEEWEKID